MNFESWSSEETYNLGKTLGSEAEKGQVYSLDGDLGAGKTVFAKGFAEGLGYNADEIVSPTFTIVNEYKGEIDFYHMDVYRLSDSDEAFEIGLDEMLGSEAVCLVEWGEIIEDILPEDTIFINIEKDFDKDDNYRLIKIRGLKE
ncbi:MAG: tRNA (adenosine(37)-N6)-threonylcarbamoyltransferase complex ATPase subunit type 1 TsaE [Firmicutes bacterium]|nr:tRNA (adenosine(37)-N6)-threonylcarbamoyltransferase complex ATPase subunit type 1 TsaE [Bacillota bacterium]MBR0104516.1 tRNA (adenosine(37)-N6)-threonylcarbamoyltransferase complex ATPase subunit type 1 TsaE [Bacillota bacterium]MBR2593444.1 tRNA (adenosine(37)-N6)-threonylcarbamoyltransferase complex ATPase subunit type 1 TsaE [Bacillota bacterium]